MKKSLILLLILCFTCTLLFGCNSAPESTAPTTTEVTDPLLGKGYYVEFNAYTTNSGHPNDEALYCLTPDFHLIFASTNQLAKLEPWDFDATEFTTICTDYGYWQDKFNPEYICKNIDKAWKGQFYESAACYLLQLKDGMLMLAHCAITAEGNYITRTEIIKESCSQAEYFSYWHNKWQSRRFSENGAASYEKWQKIYNRFN